MSTKYIKIIIKQATFCHFNPGHTGLFYDVFCTSVLQQPDSRVNGNHHKSHAAFKTTLISVSVTVTTVLGSRFCVCVCARAPAFDSSISYTPVVTLITETRDVTLGRREEEKNANPLSHLYSYMFPLHTEHTMSDAQVGVTIAMLGGSKLKRREWSSPISNKSLPRKRTERLITRRTNCTLPRCREVSSRRGAVLESRFAKPAHLLHHLHLELFFNLKLTSQEISPRVFQYI